MTATEKRQRRRQRGSVDRADKKAAIEQLAWSLPIYSDAPVEPASPEIIEKIHDTSLRVLEEIGLLFLNEDALDVLRNLGCDIDEDTSNVRIDRTLVLDAIAKAPSSFEIHSRNPERTITLGGRHVVYSTVASAPNVSDLEGGRRVGTRPDFQNLLKLNQYFNCLHFVAGYPVEPVDLHASTRHLDALYDMLTLTDKVVHAYALGPERIEDGMDMARIAAGVSEEVFRSK
ncbi:MAG: trimethylamine methyltransferase family protein, partial [Alphaproteobacteria bacterium]